MKITIESTETVGRINEALCREWRGTTEGGVPVIVYVARVAVAQEHVDAYEQERAGHPSAPKDVGGGDRPDGPSRAPGVIDMRMLQ